MMISSWNTPLIKNTNNPRQFLDRASILELDKNISPWSKFRTALFHRRLDEMYTFRVSSHETCSQTLLFQIAYLQNSIGLTKIKMAMIEILQYIITNALVLTLMK